MHVRLHSVHVHVPIPVEYLCISAAAVNSEFLKMDLIQRFNRNMQLQEVVLHHSYIITKLLVGANRLKFVWRLYLRKII